MTLLSRKVPLCLHTARGNQDPNAGPTTEKPGTLTMNYCIVETYRFSQSLHNPLSLPPMENLALVPQEGPSEFHTMPKSREGLASVGQEKRTLQLLPHPHSHPEALVFPAACYSLAIWTPVNSIYLIGMARQVRGQFLGLHIPHLQRAVTAAAD